MTISTDDNIKKALEESATLIIETIPRVMATLRADLRKSVSDKLTVPQFRTLVFLDRNPEASVCTVAEHLDLSVSNVSKLLYALMERGYVAHTASTDDRRRVEVALTAQGVEVLQAVRRMTTDHLALLLNKDVSMADLAEITAAMRCLQRILPSIDSHLNTQKHLPCPSTNKSK